MPSPIDVTQKNAVYLQQSEYGHQCGDESQPNILVACHPMVELPCRDDSKVYECIVAIVVLATDKMIMKLDTA